MLLLIYAKSEPLTSNNCYAEIQEVRGYITIPAFRTKGHEACEVMKYNWLVVARKTVEAILLFIVLLTLFIHEREKETSYV